MEMKSKVLKIIILLETIIVTLLAGGSILLCNSIEWMFQTWQHLTMDELLYQLNAPVEGVNQSLIFEYINFCIPGMVMVLLLMLTLIIGLRKKKKVYQAIMGGIALISIVAAGINVHMALKRLDVVTYAENKNTYSDFVAENYADPADVELEFPAQKRNLIYIYLESMETTYAAKEDGGAFETGCIPELVKIAQENEDFSGSETTINGGYSMPSTTWTIAAMFAQTSGLPLVIPIEKNAMDTQESFFPGVITLGDILQQQGYSQYLLIGSDATFGGRRLLFTQHGNYEMRDYNYAIETGRLPSDYAVWWGYEDQKLFEYAKQDLMEISAQNQPFNFTILTVDTHADNGYYCQICGNEFGDNQYANVMACSSKQVQEFISWVQEQDFYENTTIIISGDHPTMDGDFCDDVAEEYVRKVYTAYINPAVEVEDPDNRREFTTFDAFPTTLASIGVKIQGNRLGLGTNLFSKELTLTEQHGREKVEEELSKQSKMMTDLAAGIDQNKRELLVRTGQVPGVTVDVYDYDYATETIPIHLFDIEPAGIELTGIDLCVWTEEDQSDMQWIQAEMQWDWSYMAYISVPNFNYKTGEYYIEAYLVDEEGGQHFAGNGTAYVN